MKRLITCAVLGLTVLWCSLGVNGQDSEGPRFINITKEAGVAGTAQGNGVAIFDYDEDGFPDLFVSGKTVRNSIYRNLGGGRFEEVQHEPVIETIKIDGGTVEITGQSIKIQGARVEIIRRKP